MNQPTSSTPRRFFVKQLKVGAAATVAFGAVARAQVKPAAKFEAARHDKDDWLDAIPGKHRLVFDTTNAEGFSDALLFANNYLLVNRNDYGLKNEDSAVIVVARHLSTIFGFSDEMWAKYGVPMADGFVDPKTKQTPKTNIYKGAGAMSIDSLAKQGVQFAVCSMATRRVAGQIAKAMGGDAAKFFDELTANLIPNARMVPAGITIVSRAQERGYTLVTP